MPNKMIDAVSYDLSQTFTDFEKISELVKALGNPPELGELEKVNSTGSICRLRFELWLKSNLEVNFDAAYRAHENLRPGVPGPGGLQFLRGSKRVPQHARVSAEPMIGGGAKSAPLSSVTMIRRQPQSIVLL